MAIGTAATSNNLGESSIDKCVPEAKVISDTAGLEESKDNVGSSTSSPAIDPECLKAAISGDATSMHDMASQDPNVLLGTTAAGNTCLHISCTQGHEEFCKTVVVLKPSLLAAVNAHNETPLITAAKHGSRASLSLPMSPAERGNHTERQERMQRTAPRHPQRRQQARAGAHQGGASIVASFQQRRRVTLVHCSGEESYRCRRETVGDF